MGFLPSGLGNSRGIQALEEQWCSCGLVFEMDTISRERKRNLETPTREIPSFLHFSFLVIKFSTLVGLFGFNYQCGLAIELDADPALVGALGVPVSGYLLG